MHNISLQHCHGDMCISNIHIGYVIYNNTFESFDKVYVAGLHPFTLLIDLNEHQGKKIQNVI